MPRYFDLEVSLIDIEPRIWRRFLLSEAATFLDLHAAIQDAMGWEEEHLYAFQDANGKRPLADDVYAGAFDRQGPPADRVSLSSHFRRKGSKCRYTYDFGDNWEHAVVLKGLVEDPGRFKRRLLDGARACPPEDCGGVWGYADCCRVQAMTDAEIEALGEDGEETAWRREWIGDWAPEAFDLKRVKARFDK